MTSYLENLSPIERLQTYKWIESADDIPELFNPLISTAAKDKGKDNKVDSYSPVFLQPLIFLSSIDSVFEKLLAYKTHIYLLDDKTINSFFSKNFGISISNIQKVLEMLQIIGLIYRFPAATKFGYKNINQLRLNGWGRQFLSELEYTKSDFFKKCSVSLETEIERELSSYKYFIELCNSDERPLNLNDIHRLNSSLPISIVT